jgi:hypothetical protein
MFFDTNQVNDILLCLHCQGRLEEPKFIPCGETICSFCEKSIQVNDNLFDCFICKQKHEMPKNGLPDNKIVSKMLSVELKKVSRGIAFDSLMKLLDEIQKKSNIISLSINKSSDLVKEHCLELRSNVQQAAEEVILQVDDISTKIMEEIDEYEKELIEFNKNNPKLLDEFNKIAKELETFHKVNTEYLKQYDVDEKLIIKSNEEATILINKAELEIEKLKDVIFDGKILTFKKNSSKINESILGVTKMANTRIDSVILSGRNQFNDLIELCEIPITKNLNLIYRASQDGFEASSFHLKCDNKPNTLVIIKSEHGNIFGGYTEQDWTSINDAKTDNNSYIFSLINKDNKPLKLKCSDASKAVYCSTDYGPIFGLGPGIRISNNSNQNKKSISNLGITSGVYKHPYYADDSLEAKSFLAGSQYFKISEMEAFTLE